MYMSIYMHIYGERHFHFCIYLFRLKYILIFYSLYRFVTMDGKNSPPNKKSKRQIQEFLKLKFLLIYNVIELTYACKRGRGCKTNVHTQQQFDKLYVIPCVKTLNCQYFKDILSIYP
jgi:hypothetical protein